MAEYDQLGRDAFLSKYGYGRATAYALVSMGTNTTPRQSPESHTASTTLMRPPSRTGFQWGTRASVGISAGRI